MMAPYDVAIIGGGIVGLAHAWMAARRRLRVVVLERTSAAAGASVRNFGMIWPIGQPAGELHALALRSREFWLHLDAMGVVEAPPCGSIHLAHRPDALAVLEEFCGQGSHEVKMLRSEEVMRRAPMANPSGLLGGMWSGAELRVDPRSACPRIAAWLGERGSVDIHFDTPVSQIDNGHVVSADGRRWRADRIVVCSGSDLRTLYGGILRDSGLQLCKLQMMRTAPQSQASSSQMQMPHLASELTLRHYSSFASCPSLNALKARIAHQAPELDRYGIHVMASCFPSGEVILGDSHEYGDDITPFDNAEIDELILRELRKAICLEDWTIQQRWHGRYAKHPELPVFEAEAPDGVNIFVGAGGAGMTLSFGLADRAWTRWLGEENEPEI